MAMTMMLSGSIFTYVQKIDTLETQQVMTEILKRDVFK